MSAPATLTELFELYDERGADYYGEDVTQLSHALQCAAIAEAENAPDALVVAALLHDVGHLLVSPGLPPRPATDDDHHESIGARALATLFGPEVAAPVALHVTAKRWRCAVDAEYHDSLSKASMASLISQGGPLDGPSCERFEAHPSFANAVALRGWDDEAKDPTVRTGSLRDHESLLGRMARTSSRA